MLLGRANLWQSGGMAQLGWVVVTRRSRFMARRGVLFSGVAFLGGVLLAVSVVSPAQAGGIGTAEGLGDSSS